MMDYCSDYAPERECNTCGSTYWWKRVSNLDEFWCPGCYSWFQDPADPTRHAVEVIYERKPEYTGLQWVGIDAVFLYRIPATVCALTEGGVYQPEILVSQKLSDYWAD
jgi:hypothetical protein